VCIETVESGNMTKDLAISIYGNKVSESQYMYTEDFLDLIANNLEKAMA